MINSGTQLNKEFEKVLHAIFVKYDNVFGHTYGYEFMEKWMRYQI